jgi:hypothetical protein
MKTIDTVLQPIVDYLISITRNTQKGWYELEIGLPKKWVFDENDEIGCEILSKLSEGSIVRIFPKNSDILIDDLIAFVEIIIDTNKKIADKEKEFTSRMEEMKNKLEEEAKKFFEELDELKQNSFKKNSDNFVEKKKETRGRKPKIPVPNDNDGTENDNNSTIESEGNIITTSE